MRQQLRRIVVLSALALVGGTAPTRAQSLKPGAIVTSRFASNVKILFGTTPLPAANPKRLPYKDARDNAICVAPEALAALGIQARIDGNQVKLTGPDKSLVVLAARQGPFERAGGVFVDAVEAVKAMGATVSFDISTETLVVRSTLTEVVVEDDTLRLKSLLPIAPKLLVENEGRRVVVELPSTSVGNLPRQLAARSEKILSVQVQQDDDELVRLTIDLAEPLPLTWAEGRPSIVATIGPATSPAVVAASRPVTPPVVVTATTAKGKGKGASSPVVLRGVQVASQSDDRVRLSLELSRQPSLRPILTKDKLTLDLGNTTVAEATLAALTDVKHPLLKAAQLTAVGERAVRLVLDLTGVAGYTLRHAKNGKVLLDVLTPRKTEGPLFGKTIVVDPGHGGSSSPGNRGVDGIYERALALPMALTLAQTLEELGANVILTRESDFDPGLHERAYIANRSGADLFVSVHCNDGVSNRRVRGAEVYYHASEPQSQAVAKFIADKVRLNDVGVPVRGALSDYRIYPGDGFAVLRCSQMAGVLVETGYMSNPADYAALKRSDVQTKMGIAIAQGIADFFAANPDTPTRFVKPQPVREAGLPPLPLDETPPPP